MQASPDFSQIDYIASPVFVLSVPASGVPEYAAFNQFGLSQAKRPLTDFIGRTALDVYPEAFGRKAFAHHCEAATKGTPITYELDLPIDGQIRHIRTTLTPQTDACGKIALLYGTSVDITAERQTYEAQVSFETLTSEMEQFVTMAAHDLRAPMRNVALLADMLREGFVDHGDGKTELIDMMEEVSTKSMALISDVLSHARAVTPKKSDSEIDFSNLCRDVCAVLDPRGLHDFRITGELVRADKTAMQVAIRNIVDNAIKHGGRDHLTLDISIEPQGDDMIAVSVADSGVGFAKPALVFLNGGDFRVDSGYGLFGVRRMVKARGGDISAENAAGGGGIIRFSLPGQCIA